MVILQITHPFIFGEKSTVFPAPCLSVENHIWGPAWSFQRWDEWQSELRSMRVTEDGWGPPHDSHSGGLQGFNKSFTKEKRGKTHLQFSTGLCRNKKLQLWKPYDFYLPEKKTPLPIPQETLGSLDRLGQLRSTRTGDPGYLEFLQQKNGGEVDHTPTRGNP